MNFVEIFGIKMRIGNYFGYGLAVNISFFFVCGRGDGGKNNFLAVNRNNRQSFWFIVFLCGGLEFDVNRKLVLKAIFWVKDLFM